MTQQDDPFWSKAINTSKYIKNGWQLAAFLAVVVGFVLVALIVIIPSLFSISQKAKATYHITVTSLGTSGQPIDATVTTTAGGEPLTGKGYNAIDFPTQRKTEDGRITLYATAVNSFLQGSGDLLLGSDYNPTITIHLHPPPGATVRGNVVDGNGRAVAGARVYVEGSPDSAITSATGYFALMTETPEKQPVTLKAEKGDLVGQQNAIAGEDAEVIVRPRK